ncbi:MAG: glycosyltransferase family 39 protein [Chthonomonadales bacterium]
MPPIISGLLYIIGYMLVGLTIGRFGLRNRKLSPETPLYNLYAVTLGIGIFQFVPFVLFAGGFGTHTVFVVIAVIAAVLSIPSLRFVCCRIPVLLQKFKGLALWEKASAFALLILLALTLLRAVCPITDDDGLSYHLAAAVRMVDAHQFTYLPTLTYTNWPMGVESQFAFMLGLSGDAPVGIIQFLFATLTLLLVMLIARRIAGPTAGWAAGMLMLTYKVFWEEAVAAHVDLGTALFATAASFAAREFLIKRDRPMLILTALFAGLAATSKLNGIWVIFSVAAVIWFGLRESAEPPPFREKARVTLQFLVVAGLVVTPWFIKTWVITGNPFYPMFYNIFHGLEWTSTGWARIQYYFLLMNTPPGVAPTVNNLRLARLALAGAMALIAYGVYRISRKSEGSAPGRMAVGFATLVFAGSGYNLRFLLASYPAAMFCGALNFKNGGRFAKVFVLVLLVALTYRVGGKGLDPKLPTALRVAFGQMSTDDYLHEMLPDYGTVRYANSVLKPTDCVLVGTWEESTAHYRPLAIRANYWLQDSVHYETDARLDADLARLHVTHLALKPMEEEWCRKSSVCNGRMETETAALIRLAARRGKKLYSENNVTLYELTNSRK